MPADERTDTADKQTDTPSETCEQCGAPIDTSDWYPVTKRRGSADSLELLSFCSEACQTAWHEEHSG